MPCRWRIMPGSRRCDGTAVRAPAPSPGQVAIAIEASGINFRDVLKVLDLYPLDRSEWRWLGDECAGRVVAVGAGVQGFNVGDPVVAIAPGCMASDVVADARLVAPRPPALTAELGAGVPIAFLTAWYGLIECGRLQAGETALIHAAAGGVGQAAVQIARWLGARVIATASPDKQSVVAELGADAVFNSRDLSFAEGIRGVAPGWRRSRPQFAGRRSADPQRRIAQTVWPLCRTRQTRHLREPTDRSSIAA